MEQSLPLRLLIIEDDLDACENLRDILELDEHQVTFVHTAADALTAETLSTASVVLLDWKLPDATAPDLLPKLTALAPAADVVIITGHGDFDRAVSALRQGVADYLLKPVNPEALRTSLQRIAHRRWLAREKSRSEAMFQNLVRSAPCVIVMLRRDLSVTYFSPFAESLTGYSADEVLGRNFRDMFLPDADASQVQQVAERVFERKSASGQESCIRRRDGSSRWLIWNAQYLDDVDGEPAILATGQDVTEQKRAVEQLIQAERLAAIGEAMTGLAHESRNALQRSQAMLELLTVEVEDRPEALKLVGRIQEAQHHLHQLYEEVRQYAAPLRIDPQHCFLSDLIRESWASLEHLRAQRAAELMFSPDCHQTGARVDRFMMQQVFRNVLENALAACSDPIRITVECRLDEREGGRHLQLIIRDNGPGLTPEQRERIFDPFYTTKTRGTGLGMTLSKRIVEAHGGTISIGPGPGAEIIIALPRRGD